MTSELVISVIIPVFNTEPDILKRCIKSVLKINNIELEILIIDDGSEDSYSKSYEKMIEKLNCKNITYIHTDNKGVSSARNTGIDCSNGKFIMFIDSDDTIEDAKLNSKDFAQDADLIVYNILFINKKNKVEKKEIDDNKGYITPEVAIKAFIQYDSFHEPVSKLFRREFLILNKLRFDTKMVQGEDAKFNLDFLKRNPKIYYTNKKLYNYYYSLNTYNNRWEYKSKIMLDNLSTSYCNEIELLKEIKRNQQFYFHLIQKKYIRQIFRVHLIILESKKIEEKMKENIFYELKKLENKICEEKRAFDLKTRAIVFLLKLNNQVLMQILAKIRNFYIFNIKKKIG